MAEFYKYHALGNDYVVIDPNKTKVDLSVEHIRLICHRNFGIGSDGILYGPLIKDGEFHLRIFNPDGSEAEKSGNGIRMFSRYLVDTHYTAGKEFSLCTPGGKVAVRLMDDSADRIQVDMGTVTFSSPRIPVAGPEREVISETIRVGEENLTATCLSIGNPHCVVPMNEISRDMVMHLGPMLENHPMFPNRINVQLLKVIDRNNIQIEIWERGAGYTLASGSSSCAAASAAYRLGLTENKVRVSMQGGEIDIDIDAKGHVHMTGSVSPVAEGNFLPPFKRQLKMK